MELADARDRALAAQVRHDARASSCARRPRPRSASGRSTSVRPGIFGNYGCADNTVHRRCLRPRVGRPQRAREPQQPARRVHLRRAVPPRRPRRRCGASPTRRSTRSSRRSGAVVAAGDRRRPGRRSAAAARRDRPDREPLALPLPEGAVPRLRDDVTVLSVVPTSPDTDNPLPLAEAAQTVDTVNDLARSQRSVMHAFVMPNRGRRHDTTGADRAEKPLYLDEELQLMMDARARSTATCCAAGRPTAPGATCRTRAAGSSTPTPACEFLDQVGRSSQEVHGDPADGRDPQGLRAARLRPARRRAARHRAGRQANPDVNFIVYHSGYDIGDDAEGLPRRPQGPTRHEHGRRLHQEPAREQLGRLALHARRARSSATCPNVTPSSARSGAT